MKNIPPLRFHVLKPLCAELRGVDVIALRNFGLNLVAAQGRVEKGSGEWLQFLKLVLN